MYLRRVLVLLLFSALVFTAVGCGSDYGTASGNADSRGKLQIEETSYDFGNVPVGQKVEHKFTVTNGGTGTLGLGDVDVKMLEGC